MTEMNDQIALIADPTDLSAIGEQDEQQIESQSEQPRSPGRPKGTRNKPRVDWRARKESIFSKMTALADSTAPPPALVRLLQSQLESCDAELSRQQDDHIAALKQGNKDLRDKLAERDALPVVPVLPANSVDMGSYIMVGPTEPPIAPSIPAVTPVEPTVVESVAVPSTEDIEKVKQAEVDKKALADKQKKEAEESAKKAAEATRKAANDKRIARIAEIKKLIADIWKSRDQTYYKELATNPGFGSNEGLRMLEAELRQLENPKPVRKSPDYFDMQAHEQRRAAAEEVEFTNRMLEGERQQRINAASRPKPPISGGFNSYDGDDYFTQF